MAFNPDPNPKPLGPSSTLTAYSPRFLAQHIQQKYSDVYQDTDFNHRTAGSHYITIAKKGLCQVEEKFLSPYLSVPLVVEVVVWVSQDQLFQTVGCFVIATIRK